MPLYRTGVSDIEGYAPHIEKAAKYVKLMETAGKIGLGLSALDTASKITEACVTIPVKQPLPLSVNSQAV